MSTDFVNQDPAAALQGLQRHTDEVFDDVATATKFLPRFVLFTSNSTECQMGLVQPGHYGIVAVKGQPIIQLTNSVDVFILIWRPKALDLSNPGVVLSVFDVKDPRFADITAKSDEKDSMCMFGPEFLLWVPKVGKWATYFAGNKTARRESVTVKSMLGKFVTFKSHLITKGTYKWHGPQTFECTTPYDLPPMAEIHEEAERFNNPDPSVEEVVEGGDATVSRER